MDKLISVIIPVFNAEKYLKKCLDSILNQDCENVELLLVDDGSTDNSGSICDFYAQRYSNVFAYHKKNNGSASARNYGLSLAQGDYISFVDADDYVNRNYYNILLNLALRYGADIVQCDYITVQGVDEESGEIQITIDDCSNRITEYKNIEVLRMFCNKKTYIKEAVLWNKIYKKELFDGLKFPENKYVDDELLMCQILYRATKIIDVDLKLYYYFMSENSQMRSDFSLKNIDQIEVIENQLKFFDEINQRTLHNMLLYRYYSSISSCIYLIKRYFPSEKDIINVLADKKKSWYRALIVKEISLKDKFLLTIRIFYPGLFDYIHKKVKR